MDSVGKKKTGLYFGSFNPIHVGHLIVAEYLREHTDLDEVWIVVSPHNPFKQKATLASDYARLEMVRLALEDFDGIRACDAEFYLPRPSYTADTLLHLSQKYPERTFCLMMGADTLIGLERWKNYEFLLKYFPLYIYPRPGYSNTHPLLDKAQVTVLEHAPQVEVSASAIREDLRPGSGLGAAGGAGLHRTERLVPIKKDPFSVSMPGEFGFSCPTLRRKGGVFRMGNAPFLMPRYSPLPDPDQALGKVKRNLEPMWSLLSTSIFSPCDSMMCLTMESPSPEPPLSRERLLSTR
mgnify:CR=1 FL=1